MVRKERVVGWKLAGDDIPKHVHEAFLELLLRTRSGKFLHLGAHLGRSGGGVARNLFVMKSFDGLKSTSTTIQGRAREKAYLLHRLHSLLKLALRFVGALEVAIGLALLLVSSDGLIATSMNEKSMTRKRKRTFCISSTDT